MLLITLRICLLRREIKSISSKFFSTTVGKFKKKCQYYYLVRSIIIIFISSSSKSNNLLLKKVLNTVNTQSFMCCEFRVLNLRIVKSNHALNQHKNTQQKHKKLPNL